MTPGQVRYSLMCNDAGGMLDDVLVYQIHLPEGGLSGYGLVVNASNRPKMSTGSASAAASSTCAIDDKTSETR